MNIVKIMEEWRNDCMDGQKLVHVIGFSISPNIKGFSLLLELYIADKSESTTNGNMQYFYGTLEECFIAGLGWISMEKDRLRDLL